MDPFAKKNSQAVHPSSSNSFQRIKDDLNEVTRSFETFDVGGKNYIRHETEKIDG